MTEEYLDDKRISLYVMWILKNPGGYVMVPTIYRDEIEKRGLLGYIEVPEKSYYLTPAGIEFMKSIRGGE